MNTVNGKHYNIGSPIKDSASYTCEVNLIQYPTHLYKIIKQKLFSQIVPLFFIYYAI